ncbi:hypothetical protein EDD17DRAFT_1838115 [Pisolithus thermaeus]|nr:hypothetical protein EDD17DRAFT_1838115 [Pisolithus thermaeus]
MFTWYRMSNLTIVYLADVSENGSLVGSKWFQRAWTLQELLAPRTLLFYVQNWSLYKNLESPNHKMDTTVLEELENAAGIASQSLMDFYPGRDDARSRLQWASSRRTTRPEDVAYSLFGIFDIRLPVLYGEPAEDSLGRLLAQIISQSGETSVLDWVGEGSRFHSCFPAHITSYRTSPLSLVSGFDAEEHVLTTGREATSSKALQKLYDSLAKSPLPRFINRRLILPCLAHSATATRVEGSASHLVYEIQASGLKPLKITPPHGLDEVGMSLGALQLVRPWNPKVLGTSNRLDPAVKQRLLLTLLQPFSVLLLAKLPHNEYRRIASSTVLVAQPVDSASILQSKVRAFTIV